MRSVFRSKHRVTQAFANKLIVNGKDYYAQFGLAGHEGIDLVPTGSVEDVLCLEDGVVVRDEDNPMSGAYGIFVTVWHQKIHKATQYCHLQQNYVSNGELVTRGQKVGLMGKTGNTMGKHLHLNFFETDENGIRLNKNNGYLGGIDPLPFLEEAIDGSSDIQSELDKCRYDRDTWWNYLIKIKEALLVTGEFSLTTILARIEQLSGYEVQVGKKDEEITQLKQQAVNYQQELEKALQVNADAQNALAEHKQTEEAMKQTMEAMGGEREELRKQLVESGNIIRGLGERIEQLKQSQPIVAYTPWQKIFMGIQELFQRR